MNHSGVSPSTSSIIVRSSCAQPVVDEKKRHEDRRDADRHKPFIADVTGRMKGQPLGRKLVVKLPDERFERRALEPQAELGDPALEQFLVAQ